MKPPENILRAWLRSALRKTRTSTRTSRIKRCRRRSGPQGLAQNSMLRTSIVATMINGGFRLNVIPADAQATLDVRALPDENIEQLMETLSRVIAGIRKSK